MIADIVLSWIQLANLHLLVTLLLILLVEQGVLTLQLECSPFPLVICLTFSNSFLYHLHQVLVINGPA